jgi:hypothetical protein
MASRTPAMRQFFLRHLRWLLRLQTSYGCPNRLLQRVGSVVAKKSAVLPTSFTSLRFFPVFAELGKEPGFVLAHQVDERLIVSFFVCSGPEHHLGQNRCEINSFSCEPINQFSSVFWIMLRPNHSVPFQIPQSIRQNISCNFLVGTKELLVALKTAQHHVPNNQNGPAIAKNFHGRI